MCTLVFEVPTGQKATTLYYDDKQGHQASAPVPAPPPGSATCDQWAAIMGKAFGNPSGACNQCVYNAEGQTTSPCKPQADAVTSACGSPGCGSVCSGDSGMSLPPDFCSCYQSCASSACWSASTNLMNCIISQCGTC